MKLYKRMDKNLQQNKESLTGEENSRAAEIKGNAKKSGLHFAAPVFLSVILASVFGFLAGGAAYFLAGNSIGQPQKNFSPEEARHEVLRKQLVEEDSAIIDVVEKNSPAVISIIISKDVPVFRSFFSDPFGFDPFGTGRESETERRKVGGGSGFFVTTDGMIVTNKHVVSDAAADYTVMTSDGKEYEAQVLARHPSQDIAIIKIEGENFPVVALGDSDGIKVGQTVIAIGYSLGEFSNSVSKGIISGLQRNVTAGSSFGRSERLDNIIQTDAAINPGNSGGPLLDIGGNVIGVNVAMAQGAENIAFALPINQVKKTIETVKREGKISIPYIGVRYLIVNEEIKEDNNLPFDYGALILRGEKITDLAVIPGSPADKAGLMENDIILEINGQKIDKDNQLADIIIKYNAGDTLTLKIWRKGETREVKVRLEARN